MTLSNFRLGISELYWEPRHGEHGEMIDGHFIFMQEVPLNKFFKHHKRFVERIVDCYHRNYLYIASAEGEVQDLTHPTISNFGNIIDDRKWFDVQIVSTEIIGETTITIFKTFWLKIVQRKWKQIMKQKRCIRRERMKLKSLLNRELHGTWPRKCLHEPNIRGMLMSTTI
jgi:uncharacterized protein with HEPN domain